MPWPLQEAINHGLSILSWFENYVGDELPKETIWDDSDAIDKHFKAVRDKKEQDREAGGKYAAGGSGDEEMMGNELADAFKD